MENHPNTPYTKRCRHALQMQLHALAGADGLTLNLHDYLATPLPLQREYAEMVCKAAPAVEAVQQLRRGKTMRGVGLPWRGDAALHRQNRAHTPDGMLPARPLDAVLPLLGVPVQFTPAATNVLLGDDVLCYKKAELEAFLRGGLMVDNIAAEPVRHGLRTAAGLRAGRPHRGALRGTDLSAEYARQWAARCCAPIGRPCAGRARGSHVAAAAGAWRSAACWMRKSNTAPASSALKTHWAALSACWPRRCARWVGCAAAAPRRCAPAARDAAARSCLCGRGREPRPLYYEDAQGGGRWAL
ncbi:MAG: hypothetical protein ACLRZH_16690 [Ruthenibacterium lactatiformans]